ncbi:MAG TPA: RNase adapter RapZ [Candidatus Enterocloster excrementipullorum]|uniref:RNase adapter RapZ n=1 Tax=Candidatus Enterocloster excrementipullorum TaxID=2838559 RepID=A0A9D2N2G0_9FIRM|nr:RNase adapter RapZ [Candidatus Enterocloster excrementipullorum]
MKLVIVTGMSGAGKTIALKMLEDMGFYCVDNLPIPLADKFVQLAAGGRGISQAALGVDIRGGEELGELDSVLKDWRERGLDFKVLFLDASDEALIKRYKETRRSHPLAGAGRIDQGIAMERERLEFLRRDADYIIDTSRLLTRELRQELEKIFVKNQAFRSMFITVLSFGFKYGIPQDGDLVFDVRFLPNPYYVEELRPLTGEDERIQTYVKQGGTAEEFLAKLYDLVDFLIPNYISEGKNQLVIAVGCTGGKHRSVTIARELYAHLKERDEYGIRLEHRDIGR